MDTKDTVGWRKAWAITNDFPVVAAQDQALSYSYHNHRTLHRILSPAYRVCSADRSQNGQPRCEEGNATTVTTVYTDRLPPSTGELSAFLELQ